MHYATVGPKEADGNQSVNFFDYAENDLTHVMLSKDAYLISIENPIWNDGTLRYTEREERSDDAKMVIDSSRFSFRFFIN